MNPSLKRLWLLTAILVFIGGSVLRVIPFAAFKGIGFDETLYRVYVTETVRTGLAGYPDIVDQYIEHQKTLTGSILPPLRFLYIGVSSLWAWISGHQPLAALYQVASFFSILTLAVSFGFTYRLAGRGAALAVMAMMACAPTQIHMSQHALVDGFFTFWALLTVWMLWENLQKPNHRGWLAAYIASLTLLVMTKENSAFVFVAILALLVTNRWLNFGTVTRALVGGTFLGPALGVCALITLAGGLESFLTVYILSVSKNFTLQYAILTGDGPWHRYLVDLLLVSPIVLLLAIGTVFQLRREQKAEWFSTIFIAASYLIMCNLKYGMNLRYANMWDAPLRLLAFTQVGSIAARVPRLPARWREIAVIAAVVGICAYDLHQYWVLGIRFPRFYEMVTEILLRAQNILK